MLEIHLYIPCIVAVSLLVFLHESGTLKFTNHIWPLAAASPRGGDSPPPPPGPPATPSKPLLLLAAAGAGPRKPECLLGGQRQGIFHRSGRSHPAGGAAPAMAAVGPQAGRSGGRIRRLRGRISVDAVPRLRLGVGRGNYDDDGAVMAVVRCLCPVGRKHPVRQLWRRRGRSRHLCVLGATVVEDMASAGCGD